MNPDVLRIIQLTGKQITSILQLEKNLDQFEQVSGVPWFFAWLCYDQAYYLRVFEQSQSCIYSQVHDNVTTDVIHNSSQSSIDFGDLSSHSDAEKEFERDSALGEYFSVDELRDMSSYDKVIHINSLEKYKLALKSPGKICTIHCAQVSVFHCRLQSYIRILFQESMLKG